MTKGKTKITVYFDVERSYLSVAHLIRRHVKPDSSTIADRTEATTDPNTRHIVRVQCRSFQDVLHGLYALKRGKLLSKEETENLGAVVLDTVSRLADMTRRAIVNPTSVTDEYFDLWSKRDSLHAQFQDWGLMTSIVSEICSKSASYCEDAGIPFIIGSHERMTEDKLENKQLKGGMDLNAKLLADIEENSDYVWRCWREDVELKIANKDKTTETYPAGTHFVRFETSHTRRTKVRMTPEISVKLGEFGSNVNLPAVFATLGVFRPNVLSLFGPPGSGKTTLACSLSDPKNWSEK